MIDSPVIPAPASGHPVALCGADLELPALYTRLLKLGWDEVPPWKFLRGERFREVQRRVAAEAAGESLIPFAVHTQRDTVACFRPRAHGAAQVLMLHPRLGLESFTLEPSFEAWLQGVSDAWESRESHELEAPRGRPLPSPTPTMDEGQDTRSTTRRHLLRVLREHDVDLDFVSVEAEDRAPADPAQRRLHERVRGERGERLYADMLFVLTQHRYPDRMARWLWSRILAHKRELTRLLGREVQVTVASLDFLTQHSHLVDGALVLCSEDELNQVADVALRDGLTGLFDQATFKVRLQRELERTTRYHSPLSLLICDLDHSQAPERRARPPGRGRGPGRGRRDPLRRGAGRRRPARYGGEEFAILLPRPLAEDADPGPADSARRRSALRRDPERDLSCGVAAAPEDGRRPTS
ncbi:MAG: hypothetical protein R3F62_27590 [Planctomycetota bacterium]